MATWRARVLAAAMVASLAPAGCTGRGDARSDEHSGRAARGGTLTYYSSARFEHLDPQRIYFGRDTSNLSRTVYRSWLTFPVSEDRGISTTPEADLATDTGTSEDGARTWQFTLRRGVRWEDGRPITCADFKYGASRVFATDVITGGPNYLLDRLDIPADPRSGRPIYTGPYRSSAAGRAAFDRAVTCTGRTITYHFKDRWADFPLAVAALHMTDPYRADKDRGARSDQTIFSNGPYKLDGSWRRDTGGTLVRNGSYDPSTDPTDRQALPDRITFDLGRTAEQITELLIADRGADRAAVTDARVPPAYYGRITGAVADRAVAVESPYTDYLAPNFARLTSLRVRRALAASTDVAAWVAAGGGHRAWKEATDIVNPAVRGYQEGLFPGGPGDPGKARRLLRTARVHTPYPITFTYPSTPAADKQAAALARGWERGGFSVDLVGAPYDEYYPRLSAPGQKTDLFFAGWGADWPSAITVTPPLFDSRSNLTGDSNGMDYGAYRSAEFEALVDEAQQAEDLDTQTQLLQQADQVLAHDVAYIPLDTAVFHLLRGSDVTGYATTDASSSYPDLGAIGVR